MLSAIFVDRPRLAIVIAIVTTIGGLLSLLAIPIAQYPDIVPPQVAVTTSYPGASAAVVDATIAQPSEAQVEGVHCCGRQELPSQYEPAAQPPQLTTPPQPSET